MQIQMVDNVEHDMASMLVPTIKTADDVRIAVAFVSNDGLSEIMPSVRTALNAGAYVEFLVGMDVHATDLSAIEDLYALSRETRKASLLCFASRGASSIYHPKMYLVRENQAATAVIGSSNLTRRGLKTNIEANLVIKEDVHAEIVSEIYSTYSRLKYHPNRVIPDDEFIRLFSDLCRNEKSRSRRLAKDPALRELEEAFIKKADNLHRPKPTKADLIGWLEMVYDVLPEGEFTNQEVYKHEKGFGQRYPQNQNIRAKIRQQLQVLHKLGFIHHRGAGIWRKAS